MKTIILSTFFILFFLSTSNAQEINLELTLGRSASKLIFDWPEGLTNESSLTEPRLNYSIAMSGQIYKYIYLKAEFGNNYLKQFVDAEYTYQDEQTRNEYKLVGWFSSDQIYMGFYPEFRIGEDIAFYVNAGVGFYNHVYNRFTNGYRSSLTGPRIDAKDINMAGGNTSATTVNIGVNPKIGNVGFIANVGYSKINATKRNAAMPGIGAKQWNVKMGVSFRMVGKKNELLK